MTQNGFIDVHSHLLPGIDDGCRTLEDSVRCVRKLQEFGFRGTICTPHVCTREFPDNTPQSISRHVAALRRALSAAGLDYPLWSGAEVRIAPDTVAWFRQHGVPTLGDSRSVFVDYWDECWQPYCDDVLEYLLDSGFQPILAHPERMQLPDDQLERLILGLPSRGILLQGNLRCIAGAEGPGPEGRMRRWLAEERYEMLATDMHRPSCLDERLAGIAVVDGEVGTGRLQSMLSGNTGALIAHSLVASSVACASVTHL